jgi:hypothetical protein
MYTYFCAPTSYIYQNGAVKAVLTLNPFTVYE